MSFAFLMQSISTADIVFQAVENGKRLRCFFGGGGVRRCRREEEAFQRMAKCCDNFSLARNPLCFQREIAGLESLCTQYMQQLEKALIPLKSKVVGGAAKRRRDTQRLQQQQQYCTAGPSHSFHVRAFEDFLYGNDSPHCQKCHHQDDSVQRKQTSVENGFEPFVCSFVRLADTCYYLHGMAALARVFSSDFFFLEVVWYSQAGQRKSWLKRE